MARDTARATSKMGRRKSTAPMGPIVAKNLKRLGYEESTVRVSAVAAAVRAKTGRALSRQRISALLNAVVISDEMLRTLAAAADVTPEELLKP